MISAGTFNIPGIENSFEFKCNNKKVTYNIASSMVSKFEDYVIIIMIINYKNIKKQY